MKKLILILLLSAKSFYRTCAPFQNLDFEAANTNLLINGGHSGFTTDLLPGWQMSTGPILNFNQVPSGLPAVSLYRTGRFSPFLFEFPTMGLYSLGLWPGPNVMNIFVAPAVVQTGDMPGDAQSIHFLNYGSPFELRVNNNIVPLSYEHIVFAPSPLIPVANVSADISAYAGMNVELRFTTLDGAGDVHGIDSISFSTVPVPEPGALSLLGAGLLLLLGQGWLRRHSRTTGMPPLSKVSCFDSATKSAQ
jgi:hypothetical protein